MVTDVSSELASPPDGRPSWDIAVVGAGMAGCLVAERLAGSGASVIVLESGNKDPGSGLGGGTNGRWPGPVRIRSGPNDKPAAVAAILGHGPGGSAALYGAALERFRPDDFSGARPTTDAALPTSWPIGFDELRPWYDAVEQRLGVAGKPDPETLADGLSAEHLPDLSARDRALVDVLVSSGHHPYRLPVALGYRPGCGECQGRRCTRGCKGEGWTSILAPAARAGSVRALFGAHVARLTPAGDGTTRIHLSSSAVGHVDAACVVLAAGALNTPRLLLSSPEIYDAAPHPMTGRGLMFHASDLFCVRTDANLTVDGPKKTLGLRDYYDLSTGRGGEIQSLGFDMSTGLVAQYLADAMRSRHMPTGSWARYVLRLPAALVGRRYGTQAVLATILEDLPYEHNRVLPGSGGLTPDTPIDVAYTPGIDLETRWREMRAAIRKAFAPLSVKFLLRSVSPNLGHPCGTVRMGRDPASSPADPIGRIRGAICNIRVADASLFPSSAGTNPALTVAANALRIADAIADESTRDEAGSA